MQTYKTGAFFNQSDRFLDIQPIRGQEKYWSINIQKKWLLLFIL